MTRTPGSAPGVRGLAAARASLPLAIALAGCAASPARDAGPDAFARHVTVACVAGPDQAETPCLSSALRACDGDAKLKRVHLHAALPVTEGVDQHPAPRYQYSATYACVNAR
ncbi:hypothetical protein Bsp3421_004204 [Burkholderia sp. FERM BP-3421]|uniref:hypothetical protein n=1 Tax=Burkholderia sp. FERM BP-3421 TaxID=1494466 RepID=UPI0023602CDE|nr:hypothetical protein [Burkholderia sp. FERM BP-3421]WDD94096.1 hypothetical protein Bsp3421_004204 [Burkholderia sp. FERM BP-3421]